MNKKIKNKLSKKQKWKGLSNMDIAFSAVPFYNEDNLIDNEFEFARTIEKILKRRNTR